MEAYDKFIKETTTKEALKKISEYLEGFIKEFEEFHPKSIEQKLEAWLGNFKQFPEVNYNVLLRLLQEIQFYDDDTIDRNFRNALLNYAGKQTPCLELENSYLCPLGNPTESSFRLISRHNENHPPYLYRDINELLKAVEFDPKG